MSVEILLPLELNLPICAAKILFALARYKIGLVLRFGNFTA